MNFRSLLEEVSEPDARAQFETNIFGALWMTQAVLPVMRRQGRGHVINITSIAGLVGMPGAALYIASKHALEGLGEALANETRDLGIRVTNVEPGPFRTDWAGRSMIRSGRSIQAYEAGPVGAAKRRVDGESGLQPGDPAAAARAIIAVAEMDQPPLRLPLGARAFDLARAHHRAVLDEFDRIEALGRPTDFVTPAAIAAD